LEFETVAGMIKYTIPAKINMQYDLKYFQSQYFYIFTRAWSAGLVL